MADMPGNTQPRGADIEVWEDWPAGHGYDDVSALVPRRIKINGAELLAPDDRPVLELSRIDGKNCLAATVNMFVRSLVIHPVEFEPPADYVTPERRHAQFCELTPSYKVHFDGDTEELLNVLQQSGRKFSLRDADAQ